MSLFSPGRTGDVVIILEDQEIRELPVRSQDEESIYAGKLKLPKTDAQLYYFPGGGRAFIYGYKAQQLSDCENIYKLEQSSILKEMFNYPSAKTPSNIMFYVLIAAMVVIVLILHH